MHLEHMQEIYWECKTRQMFTEQKPTMGLHNFTEVGHRRQGNTIMVTRGSRSTTRQDGDGPREMQGRTIPRPQPDPVNAWNHTQQLKQVLGMTGCTMDVDDSNDHDPDDDYVPDETKSHEPGSLFRLKSQPPPPQLDDWVTDNGWAMDDADEPKVQEAIAQKIVNAQATESAYQVVLARKRPPVQQASTAMTRTSGTTQIARADVTTLVRAEIQDMMQAFLTTQDKMQASILQLQTHQQQEIIHRQVEKLESVISQKRLEVNQVDLMILAQDNPNPKLLSHRDMGTEEIARLVGQLATLQKVDIRLRGSKQNTIEEVMSQDKYNEDLMDSDKKNTTRTYRNATEAIQDTHIYKEAPLEVESKRVSATKEGSGNRPMQPSNTHNTTEVPDRQQVDILDNNTQETNRTISHHTLKHTIYSTSG
eukprot:gene10403-21692_t